VLSLRPWCDLVATIKSGDRGMDAAFVSTLF